MRRPSAQRLWLLAAATSAVTLLACGWITTWSRDHHYEMKSGHAGAPGIHRILLLPADVVFDAEPHPLLERSDQVTEEIDVYLNDHGIRTDRADPELARLLWRRTANDLRPGSGGDPDWGEVVQTYALHLGDRYSFDAFIVPTLMYREITLDHQRAVFDGVVRKVHVEEDTWYRLHTVPERSKIGALSLHVIVYDRDGGELYHGVGGLDLIHEIFYSKRAQRWLRRSRDDVFSNPKHLRHGIGVALEPYLDWEGVAEATDLHATQAGSQSP